MASVKLPFQVPYRDQLTNSAGFLSQAWTDFFRSLRDRLEPLGVERVVPLSNNIASATDIEGLSFNKANTSQAIVDYIIQRVTTGSGATESVAGGSFTVVYKPTSNSWVLTGGPTTVGVTLSITSSGQVQYTSTNITGTAYISRIVFRARVLAGKTSAYSGGT